METTLLSILPECGSSILQFLPLHNIAQFSQCSRLCSVTVDEDDLWISLFKKYCPKITVVPNELFSDKWKELFKLCHTSAVRFFNTILGLFFLFLLFIQDQL
jgi:hypothetical protein